MTNVTLRERPTLGALLVAFLVSLLNWGVDLVPDTVPGEVVASGYALAALAIALVVGQLVQKLGRHAPWAADTHAAAVAYALTLDPADHPLDQQAVHDLLVELGVPDGIHGARAVLGLDGQAAA